MGLIIGFFIRDFKLGLKHLIPASCTYEGGTYKSGEGFPAVDGCNSCSCQNGEVNCTLLACSDVPPENYPPIPPDEPPPVNDYPGRQEPSSSAFNENNEEVACTMEAKLCPDGSYVGRVGPDCEFAPCPEFQRGYPGR